jgi:hypothetical protein
MEYHFLTFQGQVHAQRGTVARVVILKNFIGVLIIIFVIAQKCTKHTINVHFRKGVSKGGWLSLVVIVFLCDWARASILIYANALFSVSSGNLF